MSKSASRGFTLLELVVALSFAGIVLIGIANIFASMLNFEIESLRKSTVSAWSVASLNQMSKEIEMANVLYYPYGTAVQTDRALGCSNWSTILNGNVGDALDPSQPVTYFYYCLDATDPNNELLRRIAATDYAPSNGGPVQCPDFTTGSTGTAPMVCDGTLPFLPGGIQATTNDVMATMVQHAPGIPSIFTFYQSVNGIDVNYMVGNPSATPIGTGPRIINPQTMTVNTTISMTRPYSKPYQDSTNW